MLAEIGAAQIPQILVWNKIDAAGLEPGVERDQYGRISRVRVSAQTGAGLDGLRRAIADVVGERTAAGQPAASPELLTI